MNLQYYITWYITSFVYNMLHYIAANYITAIFHSVYNMLYRIKCYLRYTLHSTRHYHCTAPAQRGFRGLDLRLTPSQTLDCYYNVIAARIE